jgi:hypothetical protein
MTLAPQHFYTFRSSQGSRIKVLRGIAAPKITSGEGGWNVVSRPRRVGLTQWDGHDPYRMDIPIIFDGYRLARSVEQDIRTFNAMAMGRDFTPPPTIHVDGALPVGGATWVIESIDWGDLVYWEKSPQGRYFRTRQDAVAHMLQYEAEKTLKITIAKQLPNTYTTHGSKETLRSIAKNMYGNATRWKDIQKANPKIRDPNKIPDKTTLRIP